MARQKNKTLNVEQPKPVPKKPLSIRKCIGGIFFCFFWLLSIIAGFFLFICPVIPVAFISPRTYRKWTDIVFGMWEPYPVAMMEIFFGVRVTMSGDKLDPCEGAIIVMNHRTRLDWNFLWAAAYHAGHPHNHSLKFILKAGIMHIPGPGWVMQACSFLFINRNWRMDQELMGNSLDYLRDTDRHCQILIFPEGTDLTARSLEKSHHFADKNKLGRYYRVLHPKTTGFAYLVNKMRLNGQLSAVYDFTIAYPKTLPETELDLLRGNFPEELHFNIERYDAEQLPYSEGKLREWLIDIWKGKEHTLHRFYTNGSFTEEEGTPDCAEQNNVNERKKNRSGETFNHQPCSCTAYFSDPGVTTHFFQNSDIMFIVDGNTNIPPESCILRPPQSSLKNVQRSRADDPGHMLYLALFFWTFLVVIFIYNLFTNYFCLMWVLFNTLLFISMSMVSNGFHQILARFNREPLEIEYVEGRPKTD